MILCQHNFVSFAEVLRSHSIVLTRDIFATSLPQTSCVTRRGAFKLPSMTRHNDKNEADSATIREFVEAIRLLATQLERHADFMDESGLKRVLTTHWDTAKIGVDKLSRFAGAVQRSVIEARMSASLEKMAPESKPGREVEEPKQPKKPPAKKKSP